MADRATIENLELQAQTRLFNTWAMRTRHTLAQVLARGYFDECVLIGMRRGDVVNALLDDGENLQHVRLVVTEASARDRILHLKLLGPPVPGVAGVVNAVETGEDVAAVH